MKRTFSWLISPALALTILVTSPLVLAAGRKGPSPLGQFQGNRGGNGNSNFLAPMSGNKGNHSSQVQGIQGIRVPQKLVNTGSGTTFKKTPGLTLPGHTINPGFGPKPVKPGQVRPFPLVPGTVFNPPHGGKPPIVIDPSVPPILDPHPGQGGNGGNGNGGGQGHGNGHGHQHWPHHWGHCHNWYWDYGFSCPRVTPCQLPIVNYVPAPVTVVEVQTSSVDGLFSSLDASGADLLVAQVQMLEAGNAQSGPLLRVLIANQGNVDVSVPTRLALVALKDGPATADSPRVMTEVKALKAGETTSLEIRLPATATAMPKLLVAVEVPKSVMDVNEQNNLAQGDMTALLTAMK